MIGVACAMGLLALFAIIFLFGYVEDLREQVRGLTTLVAYLCERVPVEENGCHDGACPVHEAYHGCHDPGCREHRLRILKE